MRKNCLILLLLLAALPVLADEAPPIVGGVAGVTLSSLANTKTLVTVVLRDRGAADPNLRIVDVGPDYFAVQGSDDAPRTAYRFSSVREVRVQAEKVEEKKLNIEESRSLRAEEQRVVSRAFERAREIFDAASADQPLKMRAAMLLVIGGNKDAREYLDRLASSNDVATEIDAVLSLYQAGGIDNAASTIEAGLASGNRAIKGKAATMAGLLGDRASISELTTMLADRNTEIWVPAAKALGRLECRETMPTLVDMLLELNEEKANAAVFALCQLGGPDVVSALKAKLSSIDGMARYRIGLILYRLGDPEGKKMFSKEIMKVPTMTPDAALVLAADKDWEAMQYLRRRLKERYNETEENMLYRAKAAVALLQGGDLVAASHLQTLLRSDKISVKRKICVMIAELGKRRQIPIVQPAMESSDNQLALDACTAAIAMARPSFCDRIKKVNS